MRSSSGLPEGLIMVSKLFPHQVIRRYWKWEVCFKKVLQNTPLNLDEENDMIEGRIQEENFGFTPDIQYLHMTLCGKTFETIIGPSGSPEEDLKQPIFRR